jgi:hypothetical protein
MQIEFTRKILYQTMSNLYRIESNIIFKNKKLHKKFIYIKIVFKNNKLIIKVIQFTKNNNNNQIYFNNLINKK